MKTKICPDCGQHNLAQDNNCEYCGGDISQAIPRKIENSIFDDLISYFQIPYKKELPGTYPKYPFVYGTSQFRRLIALILLNNLGLIIFFFSFSRTLNTLLDIIGWSIMTVTSFLLSAVLQTIIFRKFGGRGNITLQAYINALFASGTIIFLILALIVILIIRVRGIDLWVMRIGNFYLVIAGFLAYAKIHKLSKTRTFTALLVSGIANVPILIGWMLLVALLLDYGRFQFFSFVGWMIAFLLFGAIDFAILSFMYEEQQLASDYPDGVPISLLFQKFKSNKFKIFANHLKHAIGLFFHYFITKVAKKLSFFLICLAVLFFSWKFVSSFDGPVTIKAVESENNIPLNFKVIDADYSAQLNKIVMVTENSSIVYLLNPQEKELTSINLPSIAKSVSISQDGEFAVIETSSLVIYFDLNAEQIIEKYLANYPDSRVSLKDEWIYVAPNFNNNNPIQLEVIDTRTGDRQQFKQEIGLNEFYQLHPDQQYFYAYTESYSALVKIELFGMTATIANLVTGFNDLNNIWFSKDGDLIITNQADIFASSYNQSQDMQFLAHLNDFDSISGLAHYLGKNELIVISDESSEIAVFDYNTFEKKYTIALPELVFGIKRAELPFGVRQKYKARGHFIFLDETNNQCYTIVQPLTSTEAQNNYSLVISDLQ